jgi:predicted NBD/HSP70 family sugar kinase
MITVERITAADVKRMNKNRIFRLIHYADKISRQEIADVLQLSLPTVNQNLKLLTQDNLIDFVGNFDSTGGRKAQAITVKPMSKCAVGVNISNDSVKVSLINLKGTIVCLEKSGVRFTADSDFAERIAALVADIIGRNRVSTQDVLGVGITVPGVFDNANKTILSAPTMGIKNYQVSILTEKLPYPAVVMNDARAGAYAEFWYQKHKTGEDLSIQEFNGLFTEDKADGKFYLMLDTGVGGAYIDGGVLHTGLHNRCGEIGHMTVYPGGRRCLCGKRGCLEAYVSSKVLSEEAGCTLEEFFAELGSGSKKCADRFEKYLDDLTTGINNIYTMCDSEVILGGELAKYLMPYERQLRERLIKKYSFDTDASYFGFAQCGYELAGAGAALTFLGTFLSTL